MIISLNEENRKFEVFPEEDEKILNFKQEGDISKFRLRNPNSTQEIHLNNRTGVILSIDERKKALPPEKIINLKDRRYFIKEIYYIDEDQSCERIKLELYDANDNSLIGKSRSDKYTLFQNAKFNYDNEKESILNLADPARYFRSRGYHALSLERKVGFWYMELIRMERFNSPYELPYKNIMINLINNYYIDKVMLKIDKADTREIICKLAEECGLDENIALELLGSRNDKDNFNRILDKYQLK